MSDRNELRRLAQKATKGNWYLSCGRYIYRDITVNDGDEEWRPVIAMTDDDESQVNYESNAAFIAAANPTAVLELLDEIERLRINAERYEWLRAQHYPADLPIAQVVWKRSSDPHGEWVNLVDGNDLDKHIDAMLLLTDQGDK